MFGKYKKKYEALLVEHNASQVAFKAMLERFHIVIRQRDEAMRLYDRDIKVKNNGKTFTPAEIDRLIRLCHPDKHGNSVAAAEMTKKLLAMR